MKKLIIALVSFSILSLGAYAQKDQKEKSEKKGKIAKELNLTEEQKAQMKQNKEEFKQKMDDLNKNEGQTLKEYRDKKYALKKEQKAIMQAVLTPEQKKKAAELKAKEKEEHAAEMAKKVDKLKAKLNLTEDQAAKIKAEKQSLSEQMQAIREDEKLSRTEKETKLKALKEANKGVYKKYLTEDQYKQWEAMKQAKKNKQAKHVKKPA